MEPLKEETFLSSDEVVRLVGNIQQIVHFQKEFLRNLEESVDDESFVLYTAAYEFKVRDLYCSDCHTRLSSFVSGVEPLTTCAKQLAPSTTLLRGIGPVLKSTSCSWYFSVVLEQENWGFKNIRCGMQTKIFTADSK